MVTVATDPFFATVDDDEVRELSTGQRLRLPIRYVDYSTFSVEYAVPLDVAQAWLPSSALRPVEIAPGTSLVSFKAFDHRHTDLAPYGELGIAVPAVYQSASHPDDLNGVYIIFLPVTTEEARVAGIEIADYPKIVADIEIEETPTHCRCRVNVDGQEVLTVTIDPRVISPTIETEETLLFNGRGTQITVSRAVTQGETGISTRTGGAHVTLGAHPLAVPFRDINLTQPALSCSYAAHLKMLLYGAHLRVPL